MPSGAEILRDLRRTCATLRDVNRHSTETCPRDEGGSNSLFDPNAKGVKVIGRYGANAQHTLFFIVEADHIDAIHQFLWPGFKKCTATITPVSEFPVPKP